MNYGGGEISRLERKLHRLSYTYQELVSHTVTSASRESHSEQGTQREANLLQRHVPVILDADCRASERDKVIEHPARLLANVDLEKVACNLLLESVVSIVHLMTCYADIPHPRAQPALPRLYQHKPRQDPHRERRVG